MPHNIRAALSHGDEFRLILVPLPAPRIQPYLICLLIPLVPVKAEFGIIIRRIRSPLHADCIRDFRCISVPGFQTDHLLIPVRLCSVLISAQIRADIFPVKQCFQLCLLFLLFQIKKAVMANRKRGDLIFKIRLPCPLRSSSICIRQLIVFRRSIRCQCSV